MLYSNAPIVDSIADYLNTATPELEVLLYLVLESARRAENTPEFNPTNLNRIGVTENDAGLKSYTVQIPTTLIGDSTDGSTRVSAIAWLVDPEVVTP